MKAGNQQTPDTCIDHNAEITSDNVTLNVAAALLAGGEARRLGGVFKPGLRVGDRTILDRQIAALHDAGVRETVIVGGDHPDRVAGVHYVADAARGGALGGLYSALLVATAPIVVVFAGDMPFVTAPLVRRLAAIGDADAVVARVDGRWHPLCAAYRRGVAAQLKQRLDRGALRLTDALEDMRVRELDARDLAELDSTTMLLMNVNTPDDYAAAERHARTRT